MGLDFADAEEATQEVLLQLLRVLSQWSAVGPKATFRGWLYRVARNVIIKYKRQLGGISWANGGEIPSDVVDQTTFAERQSEKFDRQFRQQIFVTITTRIQPLFSDRNWQAFWRTYVEAHDITTTASALNMRIGEVYVARSRILKRFREEAEKFSEGVVADRNCFGE